MGKRLLFVALLGCVSLVVGVSARAPRHFDTTLVATACNPTSPDLFCVVSPSPGLTLYPGTSTPNETLTITNPTSSTLTVTSLTISFANTRFPSQCPVSDFQVNGNSVPSSSAQSVTIPVPNLSVPSGTNVYPGTASYTVSLGLLDDPNANQDACQGLVLNMGYEAVARADCTTTITTSTSGNLTVSFGQDLCMTSTGSISGSVTVESGGRFDMTGGKVSATVTVQTGGALNLQGGTVSGNIGSTGATVFDVCSASVKGSISATNSTVFTLIGDAGDDGSTICGPNTITGNVTLTSNAGGAEIGGNSVAGSVSVTGTTGAGPGRDSSSPEIEKNTIGAGLACSSNTPSPVNDGLPNTVKGKRSGQCSATAF